MRTVRALMTMLVLAGCSDAVTNPHPSDIPEGFAVDLASIRPYWEVGIEFEPSDQVTLVRADGSREPASGPGRLLLYGESGALLDIVSLDFERGEATLDGEVIRWYSPAIRVVAEYGGVEGTKWVHDVGWSEVVVINTTESSVVGDVGCERYIPEWEVGSRIGMIRTDAVQVYSSDPQVVRVDGPRMYCEEPGTSVLVYQIDEVITVVEVRVLGRDGEETDVVWASAGEEGYVRIETGMGAATLVELAFHPNMERKVRGGVVVLEPDGGVLVGTVAHTGTGMCLRGPVSPDGTVRLLMQAGEDESAVGACRIELSLSNERISGAFELRAKALQAGDGVGGIVPTSGNAASLAILVEP